MILRRWSVQTQQVLYSSSISALWDKLQYFGKYGLSGITVNSPIEGRNYHFSMKHCMCATILLACKPYMGDTTIWLKPVICIRFSKFETLLNRTWSWIFAKTASTFFKHFICLFISRFISADGGQYFSPWWNDDSGQNGIFCFGLWPIPVVKGECRHIWRESILNRLCHLSCTFSFYVSSQD